MRKRFECEHNWIIDNNKRNTKESLIVYDEEWNTLNDLCELLNQQAERIAELEEQLKDCIKPKFKVGQTVYTFNKNTECIYELCIKIIRIEINEISEFNSLVYLAERLEDGNFFGYFEVELFTTKEEAQAKLQELQGEIK